MAVSPIRWTVAPACAARFTPAVLDALVARRNVAQETVRRELQYRRVSLLRLALSGFPEVYLKEYRIPLSKPFRALLRPPGFDEWRMAQALLEKKIPTFTPIAIGAVSVCGVYRRVFLVTEAIPDCMTLKEYIDRHGPRCDHNGARAEDLIDLFAAFAVQLRKANVVHRDLHWGNILIQRLPDGGTQFYLIDLHQARIRNARRDQEGISNLALLSAALWGNVPSRSKLQFLKAYCRDFLLKRESFLHMRDAVQEQSSRLVRRQWKKKAARCLHENKYFKKIRCGRCSGFARRDCPESVLKLMDNPDRLFGLSDAQVLKDSRTTSSLILKTTDAGPLFLKRYNRKGAWHVLRHLFRSSRARRVWVAAHSMIARDLPTPRPLLFLEERRLGVVTRSLFVSRAIVPAVTLCAFASDNFAGLDRREKHACIRAFAHRLRDMHDRGVRHGDLKATNIVLKGADPVRHPEIYFVDLDAVKIKKSLSFKDRCRDIARLNRAVPDPGPANRSHRLLFLRAYLGAVKREELRTAWRMVRQLTYVQLRPQIHITTKNRCAWGRAGGDGTRSSGSWRSGCD